MKKKLQITTDNDIIINLTELVGATKAVKYYIEYLQNGKVDNEIIQNFFDNMK